MNSITKHLTPESIISTLRHMRSGTNDIILVVEGDCDISLLSAVLDLPRSCFVSCAGKERLIQVFDSQPRKEIDSGMIFIRDADFDGLNHDQAKTAPLYVSDRYDFEMSLLEGRLFSRMMTEHARTRADPQLVSEAFSRIVAAASYIGSLRRYARDHGLPLRFEGAELRFVNGADLAVNVERMVNYYYSRTVNVPSPDTEAVADSVRAAVAESTNEAELACGKDFLRIMSIAIHKTYAFCRPTDCTPDVLTRMFRIACHREDVERQTFWPLMAVHIQKCAFHWRGIAV